MIELQELQLNDTFVMQVMNNATGLPIPGMTVTLKNKYSVEYMQRVSELARSEPQNAKPDLARSQKRGTEVLAAVCVGWTGFEDKGKPVEFSKDAIKDLMNRYPLFRKQIDKAVDDDSNFMPSVLTA